MLDLGFTWPARLSTEIKPWLAGVLKIFQVKNTHFGAKHYGVYIYRLYQTSLLADIEKSLEIYESSCLHKSHTGQKNTVDIKINSNIINVIPIGCVPHA